MVAPAAPGGCIDAIVVAYNSGPDLAVAVRHLLASPLLATVIVVDNASVDGCCDFLVDRESTCEDTANQASAGNLPRTVSRESTGEDTANQASAGNLPRTVSRESTGDDTANQASAGNLPRTVSCESTGDDTANQASAGNLPRTVSYVDPRVRLLRQDRNLGFGAAINLAAATWATAQPWLLLVNPDLELPPAQLAVLLAGAEAEPDLGAASAQLVFADGRPEPASLRRDPTPGRVFNQISGLARLLGLPGVNQRPGPGRNVVEACSGALMLLPRSAFDQVGGFDRGYFLHVEDLDLCRRLRKSGRRIVVDAELKVLHHKGTSSQGDRLAVLKHKQAGMLRYFRTHDAPALRRWQVRLVEWAARVLFGVQRWLARHR